MHCASLRHRIQRRKGRASRSRHECCQVKQVDDPRWRWFQSGQTSKSAHTDPFRTLPYAVSPMIGSSLLSTIVIANNIIQTSWRWWLRNGSGEAYMSWQRGKPEELIKAIWGWFPLLNMISVRSQWGHYLSIVPLSPMIFPLYYHFLLLVKSSLFS